METCHETDKILTNGISRPRCDGGKSYLLEIPTAVYHPLGRISEHSKPLLLKNLQAKMITESVQSILTVVSSRGIIERSITQVCFL